MLQFAAHPPAEVGKTASRRRRSFLQHLHEHNPFYLLSAASMLGASVLLSNSTSYRPIGLGRLVALIATLGVYELLLVGLGLFLIAKRNLVRDGVVLLCVEAFFLADVGFLASEAYQHGMTAGLIVNGVLLAMAAAKLTLIFRVLRLPLRSPAFGVAMATIVVLLGHPAILKNVSAADNGRVPMAFLYALWWAAAGLITLYGLSLRSPTAAVAYRGDRAGTRAAGLGYGVAHVFVCVLLASLVAHLGTSHWVYKSPFVAADLSPVLLAMTVVLASVPHAKFFRRPDAVAVCVVLLAAGVMTAIDAPPALRFAVGPASASATSLSMGAGYLVLIDVFAARYFLRLAVVGGAAALAYATGPTWATLQTGFDTACRWLAGLAEALLPRTQTAWGVLAAVGAFVMLFVGATISLLRPKDDGPGDPTPEQLPAGGLPPHDAVPPVDAPLVSPPATATAAQVVTPPIGTPSVQNAFLQ